MCFIRGVNQSARYRSLSAVEEDHFARGFGGTDLVLDRDFHDVHPRLGFFEIEFHVFAGGFVCAHLFVPDRDLGFLLPQEGAYPRGDDARDAHRGAWVELHAVLHFVPGSPECVALQVVDFKVRKDAGARRIASGGHRGYVDVALSQAVIRAGQYAYRDRRQRKRQFRSLWILRINAAARRHGLSYSRFINGLKRAQIDMDRRVLADLAMHEQEAFGALAEKAKAALAA